jgi:hypothetical protein
MAKSSTTAAGDPLGKGVERLLICHGLPGRCSFCLLACMTRSAHQRLSQVLAPPYVVSKVECPFDDARLIRCSVWVRPRRDGSSPQFGSARLKELAQRQRSR